MKIKGLLLLKLAIVAVLGGAVNAQSIKVTVNGGSGGGTYRPRRPIHVWVNPPAGGQIFDHWSGDIYLLKLGRESHAIINPLKRNITLTANYISAPAWTQTNLVVGGNSIWAYHFPPNHIGVIFRFHGSGGNQGTFWGNAEDRDFANRAVAAGYAVVAGNSADRVNAQWDYIDPSGSNPDIANVIAVVTELRQRGLMTANDPLFALGFSNGGVFASYIAHLGNWRAAALYCSCPGAWASLIIVPHIWNMQGHDQSLEPQCVASSQAVYANLLAHGVPTDYNVFQSSPLFSNRFWRINPLTSADSQIIYSSLKANDLLDGNDYLIESPRTSPWEAAIPPQYQSQHDEIEWQIHMAYADHGFSSDANDRTIRFFDARLAAGQPADSSTSEPAKSFE